MFHLFKKPLLPVGLCMGTVMRGYSPKEIQEHYHFMLNASKRTIKGYYTSGVISGKFWITGSKDVCDICKENEKVGVIPLDARFPSGHLYPPAGDMCRCCLGGETDKNA